MNKVNLSPYNLDQYNRLPPSAFDIVSQVRSDFKCYITHKALKPILPYTSSINCAIDSYIDTHISKQK